MSEPLSPTYPIYELTLGTIPARSSLHTKECRQLKLDELSHRYAEMT